MAVYRFKVTFEDNEEVSREIEIKSTQNFEDFHSIILQSIDFDAIHHASFFISDDYWRKGEEITLRLINDDHGKTAKAKRLMNKCKMASLIDDPHQKFVYVYDPKTSWTFLVELIKIVADDPKASYPLCAKKIGVAPKQYVSTNNIAPVPDDDLEDEEEITKDDDAYILAHSDDETDLLEGEEGEMDMEVDNEMDAEEFDNAESEDQIEGRFEED